MGTQERGLAVALEVRLLGVVEAYRDGHRVELRGEQLRTLLAYLALAPGTTRSIDGIVDALWPMTGRGSAMPADPRQTVHTYASRLRTALGHDSIITRDGGYALMVAPVDVDINRFESLVCAAAEPGCSLARRVELLAGGIALWHGAALDGFQEHDWARSDAVRLEEMRAIAEDDRGDALLALGEALAAVPLLSAAASTSPLRERTHVLLMTALYRCGRQAEALRVFQEYRRRLGTDLGLAPGDAIVEVERLIASGAPMAGAPASGGRAVPGYVLHERIGEGAYAVVYRGHQSSVQRDVAIKVIRSELANRPEFVRRFEAEAQLVASLEHPHIVPLYDFWRLPGSAYLVMRLFPAGTLEQRLSSEALNLDEATRLVGQVGAALSVAHTTGVIHRDVKPANVCLDAHGNFYLSDFGIAYEATPIGCSSPSRSVGSSGHAAPEQLRGEQVGPSADVYGLAITVLAALRGRLPLDDERNPAQAARLLVDDPHQYWPAAVAASASGALRSVLVRATADDPTERHASVEEFVADFLSASEAVGEAGPTGRESPFGLLGDGLPRNPYKGLRPFNEADASDFFGRDRLVERLVEHLHGDETPNRMLTVIGPSGSGKSSVVRAGLLPRLRAGAVPGSGDWFVTAMMPGAHAFEALEVALARIGGGTVGASAEVMASGRGGIAGEIRRIVPHEGELLLVIDQFEELFTLCTDRHERDGFIAGLMEAVTEARSCVRVVFTLRADFFDQPLGHVELAELVERSVVAVTPLSGDELEQAITEPARRAGVVFESGLVPRIVADVVDQPGALPMLQYALTELFDYQSGGVLTSRVVQRLRGSDRCPRAARRAAVHAGNRWRAGCYPATVHEARHARRRGPGHASPGEARRAWPRC